MLLSVIGSIPDVLSPLTEEVLTAGGIDSPPLTAGKSPLAVLTCAPADRGDSADWLCYYVRR